MKYILLLFLLWRLLLFIPVLTSEYVLSYREPKSYTRIWKFIPPYFPVSSPLLYPWANFDGVHYLSIAGDGYTKESARFFPVYPLLIRFVSMLIWPGTTYGVVQFFTAFLLSNIFFLAACLLLYKLLLLDYNKSIAQQTIFFLLIFPTSFFFGSIYSEGLFLLLTLLSFYLVRRKQWVSASLSGMFLSATRFVGIVLLPTLLLELYLQKKQHIKHSLLQEVSIMLVSFGILFYAFFNYVQWYDPITFIHSQGTLGNSRSVDALIFPLQTVYRYGKILTTNSFREFETWLALFEVVSFFFASVMLYIGWKKRIHVSYLFFAVCAFFVPVFSGTFSGLPRYIIVLFPIFLAMALVKKRFVKIVYCVISIPLLFMLLLFFAKGYFIA